MEKLTLPPEALEALRGGNKIEAIKLLRAKTGIGLAEAKAVVEAVERLSGASGGERVVVQKAITVKRNAPVHVAAQPGSLSPGEEPRGAGSWKVAVAVGVAILIAIAWAKLG